jgi:hypothetical protein
MLLRKPGKFAAVVSIDNHPRGYELAECGSIAWSLSPERERPRAHLPPLHALLRGGVSAMAAVQLKCDRARGRSGGDVVVRTRPEKARVRLPFGLVLKMSSFQPTVRLTAWRASVQKPARKSTM